MNFDQLVDIRQLRDLLQDFSAINGIGTAILAPDGTVLIKTGWQEVCRKFHRVHPETAALCRQSDTSVNMAMARGDGSVSYTCPMGLVDSCCPIIVDGRHFATIFAGQFFHEALQQSDWERFRKQAANFGFAEQQYLQAVAEVPVVPRKKHESMLSLLSQLAKLIITMASNALAVWEAKKHSEQREKILKSTFDAISDGFWEWHIDSGEIFWSTRCYELLGYSPGSFTVNVKTFIQLIHPRERSAVSRGLAEASTTNRYLSHEFRLRNADGSYTWVLGRGRILEDAEVSTSALMLGTLTDITKQIQIQQAFEKAFEHSPVLKTISDVATGRYLQVNKKFTEITGYAQDEAVGKVSTHLGILSPRDRQQLVRQLEDKGVIEEQEVTLGRADGTKCVVNYSGVIVEAEEKKYLLSFGLDLSRRKVAERENVQLAQQLRQAQKIEAIGTLAGGIAHDFNNILSAMIGYTDMALEDVQPDSRIGQDLQHVLDAGQRAKELVGQILTFSRQKETERAILQPASVIKEVVKMLRSTLPSTISIHQEIAPEAGTVCADPVQLHQVVVNICTNAYHAMEETGGKLVITLREAIELPPQIRRNAERLDAEYVEISIEDTGSGMPPEVAVKVFDPFFTTKVEGRGTGMGLSIVHGIVSELGGAIAVDSEVGQGSNFRVFLPKAQQIEPEGTIATKNLPGGTESILFVDDEKVLVDMVAVKLERLGYSVVGETDSRAALELFTSDPSAFDIVITDFTMPGMNGLNLAKRMLEVRPVLPVILCTGYSEMVDKETVAAAGIAGFLQKPVLKEDMAQLIRNLIDSAAAAPSCS